MKKSSVWYTMAAVVLGGAVTVAAAPWGDAPSRQGPPSRDGNPEMQGQLREFFQQLPPELQQDLMQRMQQWRRTQGAQRGPGMDRGPRARQGDQCPRCNRQPDTGRGQGMQRGPRAQPEGQRFQPQDRRQDFRRPQGSPPDRPQFQRDRTRAPGQQPPQVDREALRKHFDQDGDGRLNEREQAMARKAVQERMQRAAGQRGPSPDHPQAQRDRPQGPPSARPQAQQGPSREELVKRFDHDGDGQLNEREREVARRAIQERMQRGGNQGPPTDRPNVQRDRPQGPPTDRPEAQRGPQSREEIVKHFDRNGDGQLDEDERAAAKRFMQQRRQQAEGGDRPRREKGEEPHRD